MLGAVDTSSVDRIYCGYKVGLVRRLLPPEAIYQVSGPPGGLSEAAPPVPIPNTAVKRLSADDTASERAWENRPLPGVLCFFRTFGTGHQHTPASAEQDVAHSNEGESEA